MELVKATRSCDNCCRHRAEAADAILPIARLLYPGGEDPELKFELMLADVPEPPPLASTPCRRC